MMDKMQKGNFKSLQTTALSRCGSIEPSTSMNRTTQGEVSREGEKTEMEKGCGSSGTVPTWQVQGPEFKPWY
jgi:hypothetical protein